MKPNVVANMVIALSILAIIAAAFFGILATYAELTLAEPIYNVYIKISALFIGIAGVVVALFSVVKEKAK
jgi:hypothetical protein